jgi:tetratricopeptide (TPR) repeat protein
VEADPGHAEAHRWAAETYGERGDLPNEYRMARGAFRAAPGNPLYFRVYHEVLTEKLGDYRQALAAAQEALATGPDVEVHWRLGYLYGYLGDDERSVTHYRQAAALDPGNPDLVEGLANGLRNLGRAEAAIAAYRQALVVAPHRARTHRLLARVYHDRGRWKDAIHAYEQAIALGDRDTATLENLSAVYHVTSKFDRAEACFRDVLAADPQNPRALRLLPEVRENLRLQDGTR